MVQAGGTVVMSVDPSQSLKETMHLLRSPAVALLEHGLVDGAFRP
ncbi:MULTISPECIES: hypothetical protein [unclassified Synechococcus]|nr:MULTISPECIES: hypothetical protein [unclassified Synechococcus]